MSNSRFYEEEKERILNEVRKRLEELFPHKLHFPTCYKHKTEMCEVSQKGQNTYFECFERGCGHREYSI